MIRLLRITLAALLLAGTAGATQRTLTGYGGGWPMVIASGDTITVDGNNSTHTHFVCPSATVLDFPNSNVTDVVIDLDLDTVEYAASGTPTSGYFINGLGDAAARTYNNVKIWGSTSDSGGVIMAINPASSGVEGLILTSGTNWDVRYIRVVLESKNGNPLKITGSGWYQGWNMWFENNEYVQKCTLYTSRESYDGAAVKFALTPPALDSAQGEYYHFMFYKDSIVETHHQGFHVRGHTIIDQCYIEPDGYNGEWVDEYTWGTAPIGASWANPYAIHLKEATGGATIRNTKVRSGTTWYGCRGVLFEKCRGGVFGADNDSVYMYNNDISISEGPYMEAEGVSGNMHVLRIRDTNNYLSIRGNILEGKFDKDAATNYASQQGRVLFITHSIVDIHMNFSNNRVLATTLSANGAQTYSVTCGLIEGGNVSAYDEVFAGNYFESFMRILGFGNDQSYLAGFGMTGRDTLAFGSTTVTGFKTLTMGRSSGGQNSLDDTLTDLTYLNGASPYDVTFNGTGLTCEYFVGRTTTVTVLGNNGYPVPGATVRVWNKYGDTTNNGTAVASGTSDANGQFTSTEIIHYESDDNPDSLHASFVPFYAKATYAADQKGDTSSVNYTLAPGNWPISLTLPSTPGTPPAGAVKAFKGLTLKGGKI